MADILESLNKEQKEAVLKTDGAVLVLAGAGTGKTKVLTSKIAFLLQSGLCYPSEILAVTFTNKASREMQERVANLLGKDISPIWLGTFHSIANKILRQHCELVGLTSNYTIMDPDDQNRLIKQIMINLEIDTKEYPVKNYVNKINEWKDKGITCDKVLDLGIDFNYYPEIKEIYKIYQDECKTRNACDFGDLLLLNVEIFKKNKDVLMSYIGKFKYILVDEYQDTNSIQHTWLKLISGLGLKDEVNITCVGDDDQSIYGWRGAEIENILRFEKEFKNTKIIKLERNYRSTSNILNVASGIISYNKDRHKKTLWTDSKNIGNKISLTCFDSDREEAITIANDIINICDKIEYKDIAVLIRTGYQTRIFEEVFISQSIPYKIVGGFKFYDRKEIKDCIAYLRLVKNHSDVLAFERIINVPRRGIGSVTLSKIMEQVRGEKVDILDICESMCLSGQIKGKTAENLLDFVNKIRKYSNEVSIKDHITLSTEIIYGVGYVESLQTEKTDESKSATENINDLQTEKTDESKSTIEENINEFIRSLAEFSSLDEFLEYISLVNDKTNSTNDNSVNLMTMHSAKGLEFDLVFLPGWEEGVFPSPRSVDERNGLEEERRLAYVAITRAKNNLKISYSKTRYEYGEFKTTQVSRFIKELPEEYLETHNINFVSQEELEDEDYSNSKVGRYRNYCQPKNFNKKDDDDFIISKDTPVKPLQNLAKRVLHPTFGEGVVIRKEGKKLTIAFKNGGLKTIIEDFVKVVN